MQVQIELHLYRMGVWSGSPQRWCYTPDGGVLFEYWAIAVQSANTSASELLLLEHRAALLTPQQSRLV